jgi:hypothetical protein
MNDKLKWPMIPRTRATITQSERFMLLGLYAQASYHNQQLRDIERAAAHLLQAQSDEHFQGEDWGQISDMIYGEPNQWHPDRLLDVLGIEIVPDPSL